MIIEFIDQSGAVEVGNIINFIDASETEREVPQHRLRFRVILPCQFKAVKAVMPDGTSYVVKPISVEMDGTACIYTFIGEPEEAEVLW